MDCVGVVSWLKCYCLEVIGSVGAGLWLEYHCLLIIGWVVSNVVIGILLLETGCVGVMHWLQCVIIIVV